MKDMGNKTVSRSRKPSLFARVAALIEEARQKVATVANLAQVYTNFEIGRQIVEEEQGGKRRAEYGKRVVEELSIKLTARFGRGWSMRSLETIRKFYLLYAPIPQTLFTESVDNDSLNGVEGIPQTVFAELGGGKSATVLWKSDDNNLVNSVSPIPKFTLSWLHYLLLMRIADPVERPRRKERRWGVRRVTIDARKQGMRRETLNASHVSCLTSYPLVSHLTSHAHPIHRKEPTHD